jgi:vanillate O-demethylase monooxygenase subunit
VALEDRCAHRAFPLSAGRLEGDDIVCGYHGFTYDSDGRCVRIPSQPSVPAGICVTGFPVREDPPFVWIWMGNPAAATASRPPRFPWLSDEGWATFGERLHVAANYMLLHEHYLDFTHAFVVHAEELPLPVERFPPLSEIVVSETSVSYSRALPPAPLAEWEAEATGLPRDGEYTRRESGTFVSPAAHVQRWEIDGGDGTVYANVRVQAFTPETADSTHLFLRGAHDYATDRNVVTEHLKAFLDEVAVQDKDLLETIQITAGYEEWARGARVSADGAALKARRIVSAMLAEEAGRSPLRPGYSR